MLADENPQRAQAAGIQLNHVPFKGSADLMQAVVGGHVMSASDSTGWAPYVESGRLRLLATYGSQRTRRWPQVPTLNELGYETVSDSPFGLGGPRDLDEDERELPDLREPHPDQERRG